jgi:hypothetical protein
MLIRSFLAIAPQLRAGSDGGLLSKCILYATHTISPSYGPICGMLVCTFQMAAVGKEHMRGHSTALHHHDLRVSVRACSDFDSY